jgi:hypothetical protein
VKTLSVFVRRFIGVDAVGFRRPDFAVASTLMK